MKKEQKRERLVEWSNIEPHNTYDKKRIEILEKLCITRMTWSNYLKGRTEIPDMAIPIIEEITGFHFELKVCKEKEDILSCNFKQATLIADKLEQNGITVLEVRYILGGKEAIIKLNKHTSLTDGELNDLINN